MHLQSSFFMIIMALSTILVSFFIFYIITSQAVFKNRKVILLKKTIGCFFKEFYRKLAVKTYLSKGYLLTIKTISYEKISKITFSIFSVYSFNGIICMAGNAITSPPC